MNRNKFIVAGIMAVVIVVAILIGATRDYGQGEIKATLIIENSGIECETVLSAGSTVFDLMTACKVPFEEEGGLVTSINGVSQDPSASKYWMYYINGELAPVGAGDYIVQNGDEIVWKLESF